MWAVRQQVGTQQGATHSPILFGRLLAAKFDELRALWERRGELPAFICGALTLWGIWFIDDAICFFRNKAQYLRLVPSLIDMLAALGLSINITKSCTLSCGTPPRHLACLPGLPHVRESVYLGLKLVLDEGEDHLLQGLLRRASGAFFSNRVLLTTSSSPLTARLRMFQALVTASILWSLAVLSPNAVNLRALRVQQVTLMGWLLRCAPHPSWHVPECIRCARHAVKLWIVCFSKLWDRLLLEQQWKWVGHVLRMPQQSFVRQTLLHLASQQSGLWPPSCSHRAQQFWTPSFAEMAATSLCRPHCGARSPAVGEPWLGLVGEVWPFYAW